MLHVNKLSNVLKIQNKFYIKNAIVLRSLATIKEIFPNKIDFPTRHIGPRKTEVVGMLDLLGYKVIIEITNFILVKRLKILCLWVMINIYFFFHIIQSLDELTDKAVPNNIQLRRNLVIEEALSKINLKVCL